MEILHQVMLQGILYSPALVTLCLTFILLFMIAVYHTIYEVRVLGAILFPLQVF